MLGRFVKQLPMAAEREAFELQNELRQWRLLYREKVEQLNHVWHQRRTEELKRVNRANLNAWITADSDITD